ncbi:MAG: sterol desaturase family protein [Syntrophales bacterium]|nr:sterol desaturase family protein [Syntrophales bacterium]
MDIIPNETTIRVLSFLGIFLVVAAFEVYAPRRQMTAPKSTRWFGNLSIHLVNTLLLRLIAPILPVAMAAVFALRGWGLLNLYPVKSWISILICVLALDLVIYIQHVLFHRIPVFWRIHKMHHLDVDLDVTSGVRFHPGESILSVFVKVGAVAALGPPAFAVLIFEVMLNGASLFIHSNVRIPLPMDAIFRWTIVTPDMHRIHHSIIYDESNSNYGSSFSLWDRLFRTYRREPAAGHEGMTIGLNGFLDVEYSKVIKMLLVPFKKG